MKSKTILIADDMKVIRNSVKSSLRGFTIIGEASSGDEAIIFVKENKPDLVILDISMDYPGTEAIASIKHFSPHTKIIIFTIHKDVNHLHICLLADVDGYVTKGDDHADLKNAVLAVLDGKRFVSPSVTHMLIENYQKALCIDRHVTARLLNQTQLNIIKLLVKGHSYTKIGERLSISAKTVANNMTAMQKKLNVGNRNELIAHIVENGMV